MDINERKRGELRERVRVFEFEMMSRSKRERVVVVVEIESRGVCLSEGGNGGDILERGNKLC